MRLKEKITPLLWEEARVDYIFHQRSYKTKAGEYAEHDKFIGVRVPALRRIAKDFSGFDNATLDEIEELIESLFNEERLLALFILIHQYNKSEKYFKDIVYDFYIKHIKNINNWNLVDSSSHLILGRHLFDYNKSREILLDLARSDDLWSRRIAIVATWYFIQRNDFSWTFTLALVLCKDSHDLIHKAVGWMLRETGKRDKNKMLTEFLDQHATDMPKTTLRYALEKFNKEKRKIYQKMS